jgi:hypothetical protein
MTEAPKWAELLPELPRLLHSKLAEPPQQALALQTQLQLSQLVQANASIKRRLWWVGAVAFAALLGLFMTSYVLWQLMRVMHDVL